jgi:hypothetical protein
VSLDHSGRGVPESERDQDRRDARFERPGGVGVPEVSEPEALQAGSLHGRVPDAAHEVLPA